MDYAYEDWGQLWGLYAEEERALTDHECELLYNFVPERERHKRGLVLTDEVCAKRYNCKERNESEILTDHECARLYNSIGDVPVVTRSVPCHKNRPPSWDEDFFLDNQWNLL